MHSKDSEDKALLQERLSVQLHNKMIWDLSKLNEFDFYTIGYSQIPDIVSFIDRLNSAGVETLVDVRHEPVSQYRPEFSKARLEEAVRVAGIDYAHYSSLGIPKQVRARVKNKSNYDFLWNWYDKHIIPLLENGFYDNIIKNLKHPVAYMCVELDPTKCHRHRIALALERRGLRGLDL